MALCRKKRETSLSQLEETRTLMSTFVWFLIKYCFVPITIDNDKIIFNLFSWKTVIHSFVSFGYMILGMTLVLFSTSINLENFYTIEERSFAINLSLTLIGISNIFGVFIPLMISDGLKSLSANFITNKNLRFPPKGCRIILGEFFSL